MKRLVVAGLGLIGARHAAAVRASDAADLVAVIDPCADLRNAWSVPGYSDLAALEAAEDDRVDGVILATPSHLHAHQAEICLAKGIPCLIEKPIDVTLAAADRVVRASEESGAPVLVGHHRRYHASVQKLRGLIQDGAIGQPVLANMIWAVRKPDSYFQGNWRDGAAGSPVMINAVHDLDLLRFLLGEVVDVSALGATPVRGAGRVESGIAALRFASGALASLAFADTSPSPWGFEAGTRENPNIAGTGADCLWIMGTAGGVAFPSLTLWGGAADWSEAAQSTLLDAPKTVPLDAQLAHFLEVIDGAPPLIDAQDARETLAVTLDVDRLTRAALA